MPAAVPRFSSAASSDQGSVRKNNEDRVYCDDERGVFLVVDGMGGQEAGEHAAEIAVERIRVRLERQTGSAEQRLREAIALANNAIYEAAQQNPEWSGMACVLTAAVIEDGRVTVGHVGDSRLYTIRRGTIQKITHDHSPVGEREDSGELTEAEAMQHPRRNEVYRDVGSQEHTPDDEDFIEITGFDFEPDSALLLCSDGLSDALSSEQIRAIVEQNAGDRRAAVRALIAAANKVGHDNISAVLVEGAGFAGSVRVEQREDVFAGEITGRLAKATRSPWYRTRAAYLFLGIVIGAAAVFLLQKLIASRQTPHFPRVLAVVGPATISAALSMARPGDTVSVAAGMYSENLRLKEGVTIIARQPHDAIIRGTIEADGVRHARLEGFQIRGEDVAIRIHNSNVVLAADDIAGARNAGVEFSGDSTGVIFGCNVHDNRGPAIVIADSAAPSIQYNLILQNGIEQGSMRPGVLVRSSGHPLISANIFAGNGAEAVWLPAADPVVIQRNAFMLSGKADERPKIRIAPLQEGRP